MKNYKEEIINIFISGDFYAKPEVDNFISNNEDNPEYIFGDVIDEINSSDISIYNQEYPITKTNKVSTIKRVYSKSKASPISLIAIKKAGFTHASIGNNHILDYGIEGLKDTMRELDNIKLKYLGANLHQDKDKILYEKVKGKKLAFLNFAENEFNTSTRNHGGANPVNIIENYYRVKEAKINADAVIVIYHGGTEFFEYPSIRLRNYCRFLSEAGADAIICHHSHVVSGYEVYNGKTIFYGIGHLFAPHTWGMKNTNLCLGINLSISKDNNISYKLIPFKFVKDKFFIKKLDNLEKKDFNRKIRSINHIILNDNLLFDKWAEFLSKPELNFNNSFLSIVTKTPIVYYKIFKRFKVLKIYNKYLMYRFKNSKHTIKLMNIHRAESHSDVLQTLYLMHFDNLKK